MDTFEKRLIKVLSPKCTANIFLSVYTKKIFFHIATTSDTFFSYMDSQYCLLTSYACSRNNAVNNNNDKIQNSKSYSVVVFHLNLSKSNKTLRH